MKCDMRIVEGDPWIVRLGPRSSPRLRLFCFPYAGGSAQIYRTWSEAFPEDVEVCAVQLPGREQRHGETPICRVSTAVEMLASALSRYLDRRFAMFGHSMGAVLAYEVTRRLSLQFDLTADHLFVSGHRAPHLPSRQRNLHRLANDAFIAGVRALNGTPAEVFEHSELVELLMPMLRADFELVETYVELPGPRLSCPLTALGGNADLDVPPADIAAWSSVTSGRFCSLLLEGDHFYINTARSSLIETLQRHLAE